MEIAGGLDLRTDKTKYGQIKLDPYIYSPILKSRNTVLLHKSFIIKEIVINVVRMGVSFL